MERIIFHIDVNNAFLSWTAVSLLENGYKYDIRDSYAVIGGDPTKRKGIVLAKSNLCKKVGIVSAETLYSANKKCPNLRVYPPDYNYYSKMSKRMFELIEKYSPDYEIASIDECYLDYGKVKNLYGNELEFAKKLQKEIYDTLGFTVNIGIANNKLCAKMASDFSKPNKIHTLYDYEIEKKMYPLPIGDLFGIGKKTAPKLQNIGINTIKDLANYDILKLSKIFKNRAQDLINLAKGIDDSEVIKEVFDPESISSEITLEHDISEKTKLYPYLMNLTESVSYRLRSQDKYTSVICIILKDNYFRRKTHQKKLNNKTNKTDEIYEYAKEILSEMNIEESVRLIGIKLDKLSTNKIFQPSIFDDVTKKDEVDGILDSLKQKYGNKIITKASMKK